MKCVKCNNGEWIVKERRRRGMPENKIVEKRIKSNEELEEKIEELILLSDLTYKGVTSVLGKLKVVYMEKGDNLLNATNIQKIIETPRFKYTGSYDTNVRNWKVEKEVDPEVPVQEQYIKTNEMHIRAIDFQKIIALLGAMIEPICLTSKFKIGLNYNPKNSTVELDYFKSE